MRRFVLTVVAGGILFGGASLALASGAGPTATLAPTAEVRVTSSPNAAVRVIAPPTAGVRVQTAPGTMRGDTLVLRTPVRLTVTLAAADLQVESVDGVELTVEASLRDAAAWRLGGTGRLLILKAGGREIQVPR